MTSPITEIDRLKAGCSEAALIQRAINDVVLALLRPLRGLSPRETIAELERLRAKLTKLEEVQHDRPTSTPRRIAIRLRPRKD